MLKDNKQAILDYIPFIPGARIPEQVDMLHAEIPQFIEEDLIRSA